MDFFACLALRRAESLDVFWWQQVVVEMRGIGIADQLIGRQPAPVVQMNTGDPVVDDIDAGNGLVQFDPDADFSHQLFQAIDQCACPAHGEMDTMGTFQEVNQAVYAGGIERIAADQQRLDRKRLAKIIAVEATTDHLPDRAPGAKAKQVRNLAQHESKAVKRCIRQHLEADLVDVPGIVQQSPIAFHIGWIDAPDLIECLVQGSAIVEPGAVPELEPIPQVQRYQLHVVLHPLPEQFEQLGKQERCRDDGRTGIVTVALSFEDLRPTTQARTSIDQRDLITLGTGTQGGGNATETTTNDSQLRHGTRIGSSLDASCFEATTISSAIVSGSCSA